MPSMIDNRYQISKVISHDGGMSTIYLGENNQTEAKVIIKCIDLDNFPENDRERIREMSIQEASTLMQLKHPNIPEVYEYFCDGNKQYIIMEYIQGKNLADLYDTRKFADDDVLSILDQIANVVRYLHKNNIIHQDLKPENIIVRADNIRDIVVIDFGTHHRLKTLKLNHENRTRKTSLYITHGYMPPEAMDQIILPTCDIYSIGMVGIFLLTGTPNRYDFFRNNVCTKKLKDIIKKCVELEHERRFQSIDELISFISGGIDINTDQIKYIAPKISLFDQSIAATKDIVMNNDMVGVENLYKHLEIIFGHDRDFVEKYFTYFFDVIDWFEPPEIIKILLSKLKNNYSQHAPNAIKDKLKSLKEPTQIKNFIKLILKDNDKSAALISCQETLFEIIINQNISNKLKDTVKEIIYFNSFENILEIYTQYQSQIADRPLGDYYQILNFITGQMFKHIHINFRYADSQYSEYVASIHCLQQIKSNLDNTTYQNFQMLFIVIFYKCLGMINSSLQGLLEHSLSFDSHLDEIGPEITDLFETFTNYLTSNFHREEYREYTINNFGIYSGVLINIFRKILMFLSVLNTPIYRILHTFKKNRIQTKKIKNIISRLADLLIKYNNNNTQISDTIISLKKLL